LFEVNLEVNDGKTVILCSKVVLNSKPKQRLKRQPGEEISQKNLMKPIKKMQRMREMYPRTRR
jgi:hypothetical protein